MYLPAHFEEKRIEVLHELIRAHPLAALVTLGPQGLDANHVPMALDPEPAPYGTLRFHLSRANAQWRDFSPEAGALAIFSGPEHYITPLWYESTREHGRAVPTWNFAVVHAHGRLKLFEGDALRRHVQELTERHEAGFEKPWHVSDAPAPFIDGMLKAIMGIEMPIERLEGKWKASQNRSDADRAGVIVGLDQMDTPESIEMARLVEERLKQK
ncbi:MAG TPA: FMN-binding negative transcriptional regulator [Bryobacteraceae bacterium]|nr:FMN-binding negative transcriptional regulator [Bryobacteraceae bacterium]